MPWITKRKVLYKSILLLLCSCQVFLLSIHCSRVQAVDLGRYRGRSCFSDSTFLSMWAVPSIVVFWISLVLPLPGILLVTLSSPFLISPWAPTTTGIVSVFISHILLTSISKSLSLDNFSVNFAEVLLSHGTANVNEHAPCFFLVLDHNVRSVGFYFPVGVDRHIPEYFDLAVISYCCWLVFIPRLSCLDFITSADLPMNRHPETM